MGQKLPCVLSAVSSELRNGQKHPITHQNCSQSGEHMAPLLKHILKRSVRGQEKTKETNWRRHIEDAGDTAGDAHLGEGALC